MTDRISHAVLITGCSTGIGRATAERLARSGYTVYATARRVEAIQDLAAYGCRLLPLDVCDEGSMRAAVEAVEKSEGAVGALVNNAGYAAEGPFEEVPMEEVRRQFETNVFGLVQLTKLVLPGMRRQRFGRIVNLSSMGGRMTLPGGAFYHATKYALEALSDALRFEVSGFGIAVVLVEPGPVKTEFGATALERVRPLGTEDSPYAKFREVLAGHLGYTGPIGALAGSPEAVAKVIERAIAARRPRARYPVTLLARGFMGARRWFGARGFDAILRTQFPTPGR